MTMGAVAYAQNAGQGSIHGRVQNATNGLYLKNVRVVVQGSALEAISNEFGEYTLTEVPEGTVTVKAVYPGLESKSSSVTVHAGQTAQQDFILSSAQYSQEVQDNVVKLDEFVVSAARDTNATSIATNEQRYSDNIKNVVASDAFGDVTEGNVGEFVKYLPGVSVDYTAADVRTISVRGLGSQFTTISIDGARVGSAASGTSTRTVELEQLSINNAARIEVSKEPTPDRPADSLGGAINLVSRSAFEQTKPTFKYKAYLSLNSEDLKFWNKTPGPGAKKTNKGLPGAEFNWIAPLSKTFGIAINALSSNQFNEQHRSQPTWNWTLATTTTVSGVVTTTPIATPSAPFLQSYTFQDGPKVTYRDSVSAKVDWKFAPGNVISATYQFNYYKNFFGNRNCNWTVGSTNVANSSYGTSALSFSPIFSYGASGRGSVTQGSSFRDKLGATNVVLLNYSFNRGEWEIKAGANWSQSRADYQDLANGHWAAVTTQLQGVSRVLFDGITYPRPGGISVLNTGSSPIDYTNLSNYRITTLRSQPLHALEIVSGYNISAKHGLGFLPFESALKVGADVREQYRDIRRYQGDTTFVGADGVANTSDDTASAFLDKTYIGQDSYWGLPTFQWVDPYQLGSLYQTNPGYFASTTTQAASALRYRIANSQKLTETVTSGYAQIETKGLNNRLRIVTGVRYEWTKDTGVGPLYLKGSSTTSTLDLGQIASTRVERGYKVTKSYGTYYPSLNGTYNITDDLILRFAYARTLGRPDLGNILPSVRINDTSSSDNTDGLGTIPAYTVVATNPSLKPWSGDNYDLALEYYFKDGGLVSVGAFRKDLSNFFSTVSRTLTADDCATYDIDTAYLAYTGNSAMKFQQITNGGTLRIMGAEFNFAHPLPFIPVIGKSLSFTANATLLHLQGENSANSQMANLIPKMCNIGLTYSRKPLMVMVKWQYRGQERQALVLSPDQYDWYASRTTVDITTEYQVSPRLTLFASARNIFNTPQNYMRYGSGYAPYSQFYRAEEYGIQWAVGVRGQF